MPQYTQHHSAKYVKGLIMADSGTAKTGSLAALANAGYKLAILDFDNGLDILHSYVRPEFLENIYYETLQDKYEIKKVSSASGGGNARPGDILSYSQMKPPTAYPQALKLLKRWKEKDTYKDIGEGKTEVVPGVDLGITGDLGEDWVVVLDSITQLGRWCLLYTIAMNQHDTPYLSDYGEAMGRQETMTELLCSAPFETNVLILSHLHQATTDAGGGEIGQKYPSYLGSKLPPQIARNFNTILSMKAKANGKRVIMTDGVRDMALKSSAPKALDKEYPLELDKDGYATGGLAAVFETIKGTMNQDIPVSDAQKMEKK